MTGVYRDVECPVTSLAWECGDTNTTSANTNTTTQQQLKLLLGTIDGRLLLQDTTQRDTVASLAVLSRQVTSLRRCPTNKATVAVAGNEHTLAVVEVADHAITVRLVNS